MTDQEQEHAAELINEMMKEFEGQPWYKLIAPKIMQMLITHFELKK